MCYNLRSVNPIHFIVMEIIRILKENDKIIRPQIPKSHVLQNGEKKPGIVIVIRLGVENENIPKNGCCDSKRRSVIDFFNYKSLK
jgi:hypothetical protein